MAGPDCELCEAARMSPWFHEDDVCWVAECEACATPMVVWRSHGIEPPERDEVHMMDQLERVASAAYGEFWIDANRRSIPDHWHVHARPRGRFYGPTPHDLAGAPYRQPKHDEGEADLR